ncbi:MAG: ABC transporter substrate-binding protein [Thermoanaerobacterales bacterium]|jgi:peptide/nickel transport system substrate-binding protein|nr:peptide ABC transporter substrate-binding protein [Thermoanaerobacterales bacterium]
MRRQRTRWLALLVAFGLVAAACGGDDDESGDGPEEADFEAVAIDESDQCGTEGYTGNLAAIEAVDELTVRFTLCEPDVAFPAKVAFSALGIHPSEHLEATGGAPIDNPIGTGPYRLEAWERGSQIVLTANEDYWGEPPSIPTVVFRWSAESAQRLVELQSGDVDGIDNVGTEDFATVQDDPDLQLLEREPLNVFYLGFNVDKPPFDDPLVRQAIGYAIDKERIVENFYPEGSQVADQFLPPGIPQYEEGAETFTYDPERARQLLAEAGYPDGIDVGPLSYRAEPRPYLPQPPQVASDIRDQLAQVGIRATLDEQESGTFIDNANTGNLSFYMLGWGADFPDATNFWDFHFGAGASPQFGTGFPDLHEVLAEAGSTTDEEERAELYAQANDLLFEHAPAIPIAYGGSAVAFKAEVEGAHASPLSNEQFAAMSIEGQDQLVWMQNGEPSGLYCADETDGEALRVCEQINESLLGYEVGGTEVVPLLAEDYESNEDLTEWTFHLREGVTFHDGTSLDAGDVVASYRVQWDAADPLHVGRDGLFTYFEALFGGFLNPPPAEGEA